MNYSVTALKQLQKSVWLMLGNDRRKCKPLTHKFNSSSPVTQKLDNIHYLFSVPFDLSFERVIAY